MSGNVATAADPVLATARRVIRMEAESLRALEARLDESFTAAVAVLEHAAGRVIVSGIGKSGIVARKIAATLTSTGTPATFLHPVEGLHGDLGIVGRDDVAILLSKSGESAELNGLVSYLTRLGVPIIALTGRNASTLARAARVVLDCSVSEEACPFDLAPTTSTTVALAMGDALAVALLERRGFTRDDFARFHPGGALGVRLTLRVRDVMVSEGYPRLTADRPMRECVVLLAEQRGTVPIVDDAGQVIGVVTAGDLTRRMERQEDIFDTPVGAVMNPQPKVVEADDLAAAAVFRMETHGIMALPVVAPGGRLVGIVHLHDLLRAHVV
ncbi:MAG TPA: KpsF/GutQ family sugar-phosphate isomerase [Longimicrobiales bacterium]|nr:KpsF/GutQ family sugar-phosphate isomerase [Longimicrobiales bacterium]